MREYWDDSTENLFSDICDLLAQHLRSALEEKPPYVKFEGQDVAAHNPGWLNAALVAVDLVNETEGISQNMKQILRELKDKVEEILNATRRIINDTDDEDFDGHLSGLEELYLDLYNKLDGILM